MLSGAKVDKTIMSALRQYLKAKGNCWFQRTWITSQVRFLLMNLTSVGSRLLVGCSSSLKVMTNVL